MTIDLVLGRPAARRCTCDACGQPFDLQELRQVAIGKRVADTVDACSERCEAALRRQYGIAGEAGR